MNPGLVVKLRPLGPWRIGPDSGARNAVDAIFHSDSLYSAVASAMARLGSLDEWLDATARSAEPAVCFSSCFPFLDEIGFVIPPRTVWPPSSPALLSARVRWKSARFVPLGIVQAILAGQTLDDNQWTVDGPSECLVPAGRSGPFRTGMRWNAAVDRLSGSSERHSVGCIEFRAGSGLWTVVSFADEAARDRWSDQLKAAFRLLADSGLGGERSRGWGRSEAPEFVEGELPGMILAPVNESEEKGIGAGGGDSGKDADASSLEPPAAATLEPEPASEGGEAAIENQKAAEGDLPPAPTPNPHPLFSSSEAAPRSASPHWLLSLYSPAPSDSVDWRRGNYTVLSRGGRIESPARWGELKKQLHMISEGSVIYAPAPPRGAAPDVAPAGFAHPVFRAGFAVSIPLPEAS